MAHAFFTQQFWPQPPQKLVEILQPTAEVYRVKQVHGNRVINPSEVTPILQLEVASETLAEADAIVTEIPNQAAWVCSADCGPVLIADAQTGQVAAIHAGWRGTAAKIVPIAIARLLAQGSQLEHLRIAIGPAISGEVYQVSVDVAAQVGATIIPPDSAQTTSSILEALNHIPHPPILPDPEPGKVRLDVRRAIALQLEQLGIELAQIAIAPYCTYQNPEHFFSYRRDGLKKVQWSGIVSKNSRV